MVSVCQSVVTIVLIWIATSIKAGTANGGPSLHRCSPSFLVASVIISGSLLALAMIVCTWIGGLSIIGAGPLGIAIFVYPALALSDRLIFGQGRDVPPPPLPLLEGSQDDLAAEALAREEDQVSTVEEASLVPLLKWGGVDPNLPAVLQANLNPAGQSDFVFVA